MRIRPMISAGVLATLLVACGGATAAPTNEASDLASPAAAAPQGGPSASSASRATAELAFNCAGVMSAAGAARMVMGENLPPEFAEIDMTTGTWWTIRAERLRTPDMTQAEVDKLRTDAVRVLNTPEAIEAALPEIRACLEARKSL